MTGPAALGQVFSYCLIRISLYCNCSYHLVFCRPLLLTLLRFSMVSTSFRRFHRNIGKIHLIQIHFRHSLKRPEFLRGFLLV